MAGGYGNGKSKVEITKDWGKTFQELKSLQGLSGIWRVESSCLTIIDENTFFILMKSCLKISWMECKGNLLSPLFKARIVILPVKCSFFLH